MDAVTLAQVVDLLNKVGKNNDASGTTTVFSRLQQLSDYVDTLETKLGLNSDASGTTTVFARLAQIAAFVDQVEGYTDMVETTLGTVNTNVNTANTNVNTANTNITTTNAKIGANTDASGTSTLFALLKKLDEKASVNVDKSACTPFGVINGVLSATDSYQTILSITGKGYLDFMASFGSLNNHFLKITVDGVVKVEAMGASSASITVGNRDNWTGAWTGSSTILVMQAGQGGAGANGAGVIRAYPFVDTTSPGANHHSIMVPDSIYFNTSLVVQLRYNTPQTGGLNYSYQGGTL